MRTKSTLLLIATLLALAACSSEAVDVLKSPCVGAEGSPCGPKRDVNGWWLNHSGAQPADQS